MDRVTMMVVKTSGPNSAMVKKMNICPVTEVKEITKTCVAKDGCSSIKKIAYDIPPLMRRGTEVRRHEKQFTLNIICIEEILYSLNKCDCQFDVKLSNPIYPIISASPEMVVSRELCLSELVAVRKRDTPIEMKSATTYS